MANFFENDSAYVRWLEAHPGGYVLNVRATLAPGYAVSHSAHCSTVNNNRHLRGASTQRGYRKVSSQSSAELEGSLAYNIPDQHGFSSECACLAGQSVTAR